MFAAKEAARPASFASRCVQSALLTPRVTPGSLYRCGKSNFKSSLCAAAGGKRPEFRPKTSQGQAGTPRALSMFALEVVTRYEADARRLLALARSPRRELLMAREAAQPSVYGCCIWASGEAQRRKRCAAFASRLVRPPL